MSGRSLDISIELNDEFGPALHRAVLAGHNLRPAMAEISEVLVEGAQERFATQIGPDGVPWKKSRRAIESGDNPPTLTLTGQLKRQIVPEYGNDFAAAGVVRSAGPGKYARIHQLGGTIRPRKAKALKFGATIVSQVVMPARPYLGFGTHERTETTVILRRHLAPALGAGA